MKPDTDIQINTDDTDNTDKAGKVKEGLLYAELTYVVNGILFTAQNELGNYAREKQYGDVIERLFKEKNIKFQRELIFGDSGNIADFVIEGVLVLEIKAKRILTKEDYYQTQRYLQESGLRLALLVNFRDKYIKPKRIVRIDSWNK